MQQVRSIVLRLHQARQWSDLYRQRLHVYLLGWLGLSVPIFFAARWGVARYRATLGARVQRSRLYRAITASKAYNVYRLFRPE